jgi:hypothetical protein
MAISGVPRASGHLALAVVFRTAYLLVGVGDVKSAKPILKEGTIAEMSSAFPFPNE